MPGERKEGRKRGRWEGRREGEKKEARKEARKKEGRRNKGSKKGRKEDKKEGTENPYTFNPNPSHTNHTTTNNNHNRKTTQYSNCIKRRQMPKALRKVASSIFAPAKTEPIWTLSEPVIKVFANWGGCAPPTPPLFFDAMHAGFQKPRTRDKGVCKWGGCAPPTPRFFNTMQAGFSRKNRTINKNCVKHVVVMAFLSHHTGSLFANEGFANWGWLRPP